MIRTVCLSLIAIGAVAFAQPAYAGPDIELKLQKVKPITAASAKKIASFVMSEGPMSYASDSKTRSYGVKSCKIKSGKGVCSVDLDVSPARIKGTITITPSYGKVSGRTAIKSFRSSFNIVTTCAGGSCGTPKTLDVTGSLWHRWEKDASDRESEYEETKRTTRQVARAS